MNLDMQTWKIKATTSDEQEDKVYSTVHSLKQSR